ncbi:MAG TPA: putative nucleotide-diphospho-sugar transferase [Hyphomicrobiaceae bacterium]|jgi:hypothetical protein
MTGAANIRGGEPRDWIVCGWFTEDDMYRPLAHQLAASLDEIGVPYEFVPVPRRPGGHQANTMAKAGQVLAAMDRHPGRTILVCDVDCVAKENPLPLLEGSGDIAVRLVARRLKTGSVNVSVRSGYIVVRPTEPARRFIEAWADLSKVAEWGDVDQTTFALAMGTVPGCAISHLDPALLTSLFDHDAANRRFGTRIRGWQREGAYLLRSITRSLVGWPRKPATS